MPSEEEIRVTVLVKGALKRRGEREYSINSRVTYVHVLLPVRLISRLRDVSMRIRTCTLLSPS